MINSTKLLSVFIFFFTLVLGKINAQLKTGQLVDGIATVIGNEIVLESDIQNQMNYAKQQGVMVNNKCEFLENIISQKFLIYEAKRDTLIEDKTALIKQFAEQKYEQIKAGFPSEKAMLDAYKFITPYEMKMAIQKLDIDNYYMEQKNAMITRKVDVTPNEVRDFFNKYSADLPEVKEEVSLSRIVIYPKLTDARKEEIKTKLLKIKKDILNGENFEKMARIFSEDPGSASKGGLYTNIKKGQMVKSFEATAFNLQEGEISDPVESPYGYHIIQLVKKSGNIYDAKHILIKAEPNAEEIENAKKELNKIKQSVLDKKMTFKEATYKYSDDKRTKFNAGVITTQDGFDKLEKLTLPATMSYQIAGYNKGDITEAFEDVFVDDAGQERKVASLVQINDVIAPHKLDLNTDYERIKTFALNWKKRQVIENWVAERLPNIFISIDGRYKDCSFKTNWNKNAVAQ